MYVGCVDRGFWILAFGCLILDFGFWAGLVEFSVWGIRILDFGLTKFKWILMLPNQLSRQADPGRQISVFGHLHIIH